MSILFNVVETPKPRTYDFLEKWLGKCICMYVMLHFVHMGWKKGGRHGKNVNLSYIVTELYIRMKYQLHLLTIKQMIEIVSGYCSTSSGQ